MKNVSSKQSTSSMLTMHGIVLILLLSVLFWQFGSAAEKEPDFIGAKKCKMCHNKAATGKQYSIWTEANHSKAFDLLGTDSAKAVAAPPLEAWLRIWNYEHETVHHNWV